MALVQAFLTRADFQYKPVHWLDRQAATWTQQMGGLQSDNSAEVVPQNRQASRNCQENHVSHHLGRT